MSSSRDNTHIQNTSSLSTTIASWARCFWKIGLFGLVMGICSIYLYQFTASAPNRRVLRCRSACHQVLDSISFVDGLPSLLPIDQSPNAIVSLELLHQQRRYDYMASESRNATLPSAKTRHDDMANERRHATLALAKTSDDFVALLYRMTAPASCSARMLPWLSIQDDTEVLRTGLSLVVSKNEAISRFYTLLRGEASALLQSKVEAFEAARLGPTDYFWLGLRPLTYDVIGWNLDEKYVYPRNNFSKEIDSLSSFITALEQGVERTERIGGFLSESQKKMIDLSVSIVEWETAADGQVLSEWTFWRSWLPQRWFYDEPSTAKRSGEIRLEMLQRWYYNQIVRDGLFKEKWKRLMKSASHGEDRIPLKVDSDWCERPIN